jgi:aspartate aminotransferase-like enzyme
MQDTIGKGRFFLPGPTEVHEPIMLAQLQPMMGHRGKPMEELIARMQPTLRQIFRTQRPVYISTSSATGMMEAAIRNGVRKKVLCLVNGAFSERFHNIAEACGADAVPLKVEWGQFHTPQMLRDALAKDSYDAVTVVHSETSTGVLNPIRELAEVVHEREDRVILVDSVSGMAGAQLETDAWQLDFVLTGSQKAFAIPPGLAFGVAQASLIERAKTISGRGVYFDLVETEKFIQKNQTPNTPALSLMYALEAQLARIGAEGIEGRWARHIAMQTTTIEWVQQMCEKGLMVQVFAPEGYRSPTVTCIVMPPGKLGSEVTKAMKALGYTVSEGYGPLKDKTIRIGHMGDHSVAEVREVLAQLEVVLSS